MTQAQKWKAVRDPLFRGDGRESVALPVPGADPSIVRHILYLGGSGRESPFLSLTEDQEVARRFAGQNGKIYRTTTSSLSEHQVRHIGRLELLQLLKKSGKGDAQWNNAFEVMQARKYVEENLEHLADFRQLAEKSTEQIIQIVTNALK